MKEILRSFEREMFAFRATADLSSLLTELTGCPKEKHSCLKIPLKLNCIADLYIPFSGKCIKKRIFFLGIIDFVIDLELAYSSNLHKRTCFYKNLAAEFVFQTP